MRFPGLAATRIDVLVRLARSDGTTQLGRVLVLDPQFVFSASPGAMEVARTYTVLGIEHILSGVDHLLFVLALVMLVRGTRRLVATITAFTLAHSLTLAAASLGFVSVPGPPVEATIALSIMFVAAEIVRARQGRPGLTQRYPWLVAFSFGLLHGLGFAGALAEVGLPPLSIPLALLFFNVGVEIGQLLFVAAVLGRDGGRALGDSPLRPFPADVAVASSALRDRQHGDLLGVGAHSGVLRITRTYHRREACPDARRLKVGLGRRVPVAGTPDGEELLIGTTHLNGKSQALSSANLPSCLDPSATFTLQEADRQIESRKPELKSRGERKSRWPVEGTNEASAESSEALAGISPSRAAGRPATQDCWLERPCL